MSIAEISTPRSLLYPSSKRFTSAHVTRDEDQHDLHHNQPRGDVWVFSTHRFSSSTRSAPDSHYKLEPATAAAATTASVPAGPIPSVPLLPPSTDSFSWSTGPVFPSRPTSTEEQDRLGVLTARSGRSLRLQGEPRLQASRPAVADYGFGADRNSELLHASIKDGLAQKVAESVEFEAAGRPGDGYIHITGRTRHTSSVGDALMRADERAVPPAGRIGETEDLIGTVFVQDNKVCHRTANTLALAQTADHARDI